MKKIITAMACLGIASSVTAQEFPIGNLKVTGSDERRINIVILPDGFLSSEITKFRTNANNVRIHMFDEAPLKNYANFYNVYCIDVPSEESGCDHPGTATDVTEPLIPVKDVNTYFSSTFDGNFTHRALTCKDEGTVFSVLASNIPSYDQVILLSNSTEYGGTGGSVATSSLHPSANEIVRHELGHSFAKLADEYWAGSVFAKEKPNMTGNSDPATVKWSSWIGKDNVGVYPYGISGPEAAWYRPHDTCKMQVLDAPFCHVCQQAFIDRIYEIVTPIDSAFPEVESKSYSVTSDLKFYMKLIKPIPNTLVVNWTLNGVAKTGTDTTMIIKPADITKPEDTLVAFITDTTDLSHTYRPAKGYQFSATWYIHKGPAGVIDVRKAVGNDKFFYSIYPVPAHGSIWLDYNNMTGEKDAAYVLTDMSGKTIIRGSVALQYGKQKAEINTAGIAPGAYMLSVRNKSISIAEKIVVE